MNTTSYSVIRYDVRYYNRHLTIKSLHEGDGWDELYGDIDEYENVAILPPYKYIRDFTQFVSDILEEFECNITDHITDDTEFISISVDEDEYPDEVKYAIEKGATVICEEELLSGFDLWRYTWSERPWYTCIDEEIAEK